MQHWSESRLRPGDPSCSINALFLVPGSVQDRALPPLSCLAIVPYSRQFLSGDVLLMGLIIRGLQARGFREGPPACIAL